MSRWWSWLYWILPVVLRNISFGVILSLTMDQIAFQSCATWNIFNWIEHITFLVTSHVLQRCRDILVLHMFIVGLYCQSSRTLNITANLFFILFLLTNSIRNIGCSLLDGKLLIWLGLVDLDQITKKCCQWGNLLLSLSDKYIMIDKSMHVTFQFSILRQLFVFELVLFCVLMELMTMILSICLWYLGISVLLEFPLEFMTMKATVWVKKMLC